MKNLQSKLTALLITASLCFSGADANAATIYDALSRSPGTNFFAYEGFNGEDKTPPLVNTTPVIEISNYPEINTLDGTFHRYSVPSNGKFAHLRFQLTIDEPAAILTQIDVRWTGSGVNGHNPRTDGASLYVWNYVNFAYELLDASNSDALITLRGSIAASLANYLGGTNSDTMIFMVISSDKKTSSSNKTNILSTDYFSVTTFDLIPDADHFTLSLNNSGIYCLAHPVLVTVYDSLNVIISNYQQQITLDSQSGKGTWALLSGNGSFTDAMTDDGKAVYTFAVGDNGTASFSLSYTQGSTPINIDFYQITNTATRDDDSEGDVAFAANGFTLTAVALTNPPPDPIDTSMTAQTAGTAFNVYLAAYGQTATDPVCGVIESYDGNKNINFWSNYTNPSSGTLIPTVDAITIAVLEASATAQTVNFTNGQAIISVKYKDVGAIIINAKDVAALVDISGSTSAFVVKPSDFLMTVTANPAAANAAGAVFKKAGEDFTVTVQVVDAEGDVTPNYGNEVIAEGLRITASTLVAPTGGRNGSADNGTIINATDFTVTTTAGVFSGNTFTYDEVGIVKLRVDVADQNYLTAGNIIGTESGNVGRFTPWRFFITDNAPLFRSGLGSWSCPMTYQGQPFGYGAGLDPEFILSAENKAGGKTFNYAGDFWKLSTDLDDRSYINKVVAIEATLGFDKAEATVTLSETNDFIDGQGLLTINNETLSYSKGSVSAVTADAVFSAEIDLILSAESLTDNDGICYDFDDNASCDDYTLAAITGTDIHYGRLGMDNGYGSELAALLIEVRTETWNGTTFVVNKLDDCSDVLVEWQGFLLSDFTANLSAGETITSFTGLTSGRGVLTLSAPGLGNDGTVRITLDGPSWLQYDYDGDALAKNVRAVASFGIWPGRAPVIIIRESYR